MAQVDRVLGNDEKMRQAAWVDARAAFAQNKRREAAAPEKLHVSDIMAARDVEPRFIDGRNGKVRALVQVAVKLARVTSHGMERLARK